jgi:hypothetical protein
MSCVLQSRRSSQDVKKKRLRPDAMKQTAVEARVTVSDRAHLNTFPAAIMKSSVMLMLLFLLNLICQVIVTLSCV